MFVVDARRASVDEGPTRETLVDNPRRRASDSDDRGVSMDARAPARGSTGRAANVEVMIRVRPALRRELEGGDRVSASGGGDERRDGVRGERGRRARADGGRIVRVRRDVDEFKDAAHGMSMDDDGRAPRSHEFGFDAVYDERASQEEVHEKRRTKRCSTLLRGYNARRCSRTDRRVRVRRTRWKEIEGRCSRTGNSDLDYREMRRRRTAPSVVSFLAN